MAGQAASLFPTPSLESQELAAGRKFDVCLTGLAAGSFPTPSASTLTGRDGRAERQLEGSTKAEGAYTGRGQLREAGAALSLHTEALVPRAAREAVGDGPWGGGEVGSPEGYLESIAKSVSKLDLTIERMASERQKEASEGQKEPPWLKECPGWMLVGRCVNNHRWAKELFCGREWCPTCGDEWSATHQRRFARWLPKAERMETMGYLVVTFPPRARRKLRKKAQLSRVGKAIKVILLELGADRGLRRWHWFGEKSAIWHPHFNALIDGGYRSEGWLLEIRRRIAHLVGERDVVVHYSYSGELGKMVHWLKYITRSTFLKESWDPGMAAELYNFRNTWSWGWKDRWGKWKGEPAWSLEDLGGEAEVHGLVDALAVQSLEGGLCPKCREPLDWDKPVRISWLEVWQGKALGAGYHELPDLGPSVPRPPPADRGEWHRWLLSRADALGRKLSAADHALLYGEECDG